MNKNTFELTKIVGNKMHGESTGRGKKGKIRNNGRKDRLTLRANTFMQKKKVNIN